MSPIRTILHPTDFSESAEAAFSVATMLAGAHNARIIVLHVYPPPLTHSEAVDRRRDEGFHADLWRQLDRYHAPDPAIPVHRLLLEGDPAEEILKVADDESCDLIVMGTHGRSGLSRLLMGSVAGKVMRRSKATVVTVRCPEPVPAKEKAEKESSAILL